MKRFLIRFILSLAFIIISFSAFANKELINVTAIDDNADSIVDPITPDLGIDTPEGYQTIYGWIGEYLNYLEVGPASSVSEDGILTLFGNAIAEVAPDPNKTYIVAIATHDVYGEIKVRLNGKYYTTHLGTTRKEVYYTDPIPPCEGGETELWIVAEEGALISSIVFFESEEDVVVEPEDPNTTDEPVVDPTTPNVEVPEGYSIVEVFDLANFTLGTTFDEYRNGSLIVRHEVYLEVEVDANKEYILGINGAVYDDLTITLGDASAVVVSNRDTETFYSGVLVPRVGKQILKIHNDGDGAKIDDLVLFVAGEATHFKTVVANIEMGYYKLRTGTYRFKFEGDGTMGYAVRIDSQFPPVSQEEGLYVDGVAYSKAFSVEEGEYKFLFDGNAQITLQTKDGGLIDEVVSTPVITLDGYEASITCTTGGASILYTIDGTNPLENERPNVYHVPFRLSSDCTVKAVAFHELYDVSEIAQIEFKKAEATVSTPKFTIVSNTVSIECQTDGAIIHYTLDGSQPSASSAIYSKPIELTKNCTIKAYALKQNFFDSETAEVEYNAISTHVPVFTVPDGYHILKGYCWSADSLSMLYLTGKYNDWTVLGYYSNVVGTVSYPSIPVRAGHSYKVGVYYKNNETGIKSISLNNLPFSFQQIDGIGEICTEDVYAASSDTTVPLEIITNSDGPGIELHAIAIFEDGEINDEPNVPQEKVWNDVVVIESEKSYELLPGTYRIKFEGNAQNAGYVATGVYTGIKYLAVDGIAFSDEFIVKERGNCQFRVLPNTIKFTLQMLADGSGGIADVDVDLDSIEWYDYTVVTSNQYYDLSSGYYRMKLEGEDSNAGFGMQGAYTNLEYVPVSGVAYSKVFHLTSDINCHIYTISSNNVVFTLQKGEIKQNTVETPVITLDGYVATIACPTEDATIRYTTDGTDPTEASQEYTEPFDLFDDCTIKAAAFMEGCKPSDIAEKAYKMADATVKTPTFKISGKTVTIECETEGAEIKYALDNASLFEKATVYTEPFELAKNCTITAYATKDKMFDSDVAETEYNPYKVSKPVISLDGYRMSISCATEGATIRYGIHKSSGATADGVYESPIDLDSNCSVTAYAVLDGYQDSDSDEATFLVAEATCGKPEITIGKDAKVTIASYMNNSPEIYYTIDGTAPSRSSLKYEEPFFLTRNCYVKAIVVKENWFDSQIAESAYNGFKVATPVIECEGKNVTITCSTPDAEIRYELGGADPTKESTLYTGTFEITDNRTIKAIAYHSGYNASDIAEYKPNAVWCEEPMIEYNGRYAWFTNTYFGQVHYTLDGSEPDGDSPIYDGKMFDTGGIVTIKAYTTREDYNDSKTVEYRTPAYCDGMHATLEEPNMLSFAYGWHRAPFSEMYLTVYGNVGSEDYAYIRSSLTGLLSLDMGGAEGDIPDEALANTAIERVTMPRNAASVGSRIFAGCDKLGAIVWNGNVAIPASAMWDAPANKLLYIDDASNAPAGYTNVVVNGTAEEIALNDGAGDFRCIEDFTAKRISYVHVYGMETAMGGNTAGWESLSLPFAVGSITHERAGRIAPFAAEEDIADAKPFWLEKFGSSGFTPARAIEAYVPYLISLPNNAAYADEYMLGGTVTFSAEDATVKKWDDSTHYGSSNEDFVFRPTTVRIPARDDISAINLEEADGYKPGSMFEWGKRAVQPFEAYMMPIEYPTSMPLLIASLMPQASSVPSVMLREGNMRVYADGLTLHILTDSDCAVDVYNASGVKVRTVQAKAGDNAVTGLPAGLYIASGTKVILR